MSYTVKATKILIHTNPMTEVPKTVMPWEVAVYRSKFGEEQVQIVGTEEVRKDKDIPEGREEMDRLKAQFGVDPENKQPHSFLVYGMGKDGITALEKAIAASIKSGDPEDAQKVADDVAGRKLSKDEKEVRKNSLKDPKTGEVVETLDELPSDHAYQAEAAAVHTVTVESTVPFQIGDVLPEGAKVTTSNKVGKK